jgi:hypothetical protein
VLQMADFGQDVRIKHLAPLAFTIARQRNTKAPLEPPNKDWPKGFQERNPDLIARKKHALDWKRYNIYDKTKHWFGIIGEVLRRPDVDPGNVFNMDETGIMLSMPASVKVLVGKKDLRNHRGARIKRTVVTAIECISASGRCLKPMIVWPASTHRSNWTTFPTPGWHYAYSESGYADSYISLEWLKRVFDPQTREQAHGKPRILVCDGFATHESLEVLEFVMQNNIILCRLPSHTSHKLQPCEVAVFGPLKSAYRDEVDRLERGGVGTIGKQHFTYLYGPARDRAMTKKNVLAGWRASGLYPFNPDKVLTQLQKPVTEQAALTVKASEISPFIQGEIVQTPTSPTSVTALHIRLREDAYADDDAGRERVLRQTQKLINAIETSFAERAIQRDQIQFLREVNNEGKARREAKSLVLGTGEARIMSYEDLEDARAKRAAKDAAKTKGKGTRGRKRKSPASLDDRTNPPAKVARESTALQLATTPAIFLSETQVAPVARMI